MATCRDADSALVAAIRALLPAWSAVFNRCRDAQAVVTRRLRWECVMRAALGPRFEASEALYIKHGVLVRVGRAVVRRLGGVLEEGALEGVMDWPEEVAGGRELIAEVERVVGGFSWEVDHDVFKNLYEGVVAAALRKRGGEYYTPDWLAVEMVAKVGDGVVMDPSCGSGTFLFHAVRAASRAGRDVAEVVARVRGMDLHPVAVVLARVTYLLALGPGRCDGVLAPVVQGDAIGWDGAECADMRVDALIGNPPWLVYRFMPEAMQAAFHRLSEVRGLWASGAVATHQDLAGLFVVRAVERFLMVGGRFAFVMPGAVLDRAQFAGFRGGQGMDFVGAWDLRRVRPHLFPVGAAVVFGARTAGVGTELRATELWSGRGPDVVRAAVAVDAAAGRSAYHARFRQGATLVPRMLVMVKRGDDGSLRSARSVGEKRPWRDLEGMQGAVEAAFVRSVVLAEHVAPYRVSGSALAVLPRAGVTGPGFDDWWAEAEARWVAHRSSARLTLYEQLNYQQKLANQVPARLRVVYTKSGMHLAAAVLTDAEAVVDHTLYWAAVASDDEAYYLCAVLNAAVVTRRVRPWMAYGKDERHIDKHVWRLPIPLYDAHDELHGELVAAARRVAVAVAGRVALGGCVAVRRDARRLLAGSADGVAIERAVERLLG